MKTEQSKEDYLETILMLSQKKEYVRAIDIANFLNYSRASVSVAMKLLKEEGLIEITNNHIILTQEGLQIASKVYDRHTTLTNFLISLGVNSETAEQDACLIEHIISQETFLKLKKFMKNR